MSGSSFHTNSQSNIVEATEIQTQNSRRKIKIPKWALIISVIAYVLACGSIIVMGELAHSIQGPWVRGEDDAHLAGMIVDVRKNGSGQYDGTVTQIGEMSDVIFMVGQEKWAKVRRVGTGKYIGYQLAHSTGDNFEDEWHYGVQPSTFYVDLGKKNLYIEDNNEDWSRGKYQHWTKYN